MGRELSSCRALGLVVLAAAAAACTIERGDVRTPSGEPPEADSIAVRLAMEDIARAYESGNLTLLDSLYHESVTILEEGRVRSGRSDYLADVVMPRISSLDERNCRLDEIRVRLAGSTAWATYRFVLGGRRDGEWIESRRLGTMILRKFQGRWLVVHMHTSSVRDTVAR